MVSDLIGSCGHLAPSSPAPSTSPSPQPRAAGTRNLNKTGVRLWTACFKKGKTIETLVGRSSVPAGLSPVGRHKATHRENSPGRWT